MGLMEDIGGGPVALDTAVFIYYMEEHPRYFPVVEPVFRAIDRGKLKSVTSGVTLLEVLVVPYREANLALAEQYETILTRGRGLEFAHLDRPLLRAAAQLRAATGVRTPDALQLAAALRKRCRAFLTNDRDLPLLGDLSVLMLSNYL